MQRRRDDFFSLFFSRGIWSLAGPGRLLYQARSQVGVWLSLVEHRVRDAGVAGSNPATPTIFPAPSKTPFPPLAGPRAAGCALFI